MKRQEKGDGLYGMFQHSAAGKRKREEGGSRSRELSPRSAKAKGVMYEVGYSMPALSNIHQSEKIIKQKKKTKKKCISGSENSSSVAIRTDESERITTGWPFSLSYVMLSAFFEPFN
jgi:hypothetical protein